MLKHCVYCLYLHSFLYFCTLERKMCNSGIQQMEKDRFIALIEKSITNNWEAEALTDYKGETLKFSDVARIIEKIHLAFERAGIRRGDNIAVCGRNSAHWATTFLAVITYGAVAVPILHEFKADQIHNLVNHSEARFLFVGNFVREEIDVDAMPTLEGIIDLTDFSFVALRTPNIPAEIDYLDQLFNARFAGGFGPYDIHYVSEASLETLAIINYTSGTTGCSKGVMLPYRSLLSNIRHCADKIGIRPGDAIVSMLPLGHVFGMTFDFLYGFISGAHLYFLTRMPTPQIIAESFPIIRPRVIACVPLVIEKIFRREILPLQEKRLYRYGSKLLFLKHIFNQQLRKKALEVFGGNFIEVIVGGAPFSEDIERFARSIRFPYTQAYGMTECGPIICHSHWKDIRMGSCGKVGRGMEVKVLSDDPHKIPGELVCRGDNLMLGYFKNEEATRQVIDKDGWLHTGDMAVIDKHGNVFIKGRCKNMLLTAAGQNIYPEEIESKLNSMPYVNESLVLLQRNRLIALVYPDMNMAEENGLTESELEKVFDTNRKELNKQLPAYAQIMKMQLHPVEFEKTAKKSIKRFLYQNHK
ncbi:Long-chain-fatty-acid--CoA ligase [gut metagenome]|uniref:Long-chain-fatty-acid--CoA ligase n=1 Tax=gut metagenome TaxID=749906 RepID=J9GKP7_9ZZZZ